MQQVKKRENNPVQNSNSNFRINPSTHKSKSNHFFGGESNFKCKKKKFKGREGTGIGYEHLSGAVEAMFEKSGDLILGNFHCCALQRHAQLFFEKTPSTLFLLSNSKGFFNLIGCK